MTVCTCNNQLQPHRWMPGICPELAWAHPHDLLAHDPCCKTTTHRADVCGPFRPLETEVIPRG